MATASHLLLCSAAFLLAALLGCSQGLHVVSAPLMRDAELLENGAAVLLGLDGDAMLVKKRDSGVWFGPRLGRRERRSVDELELEQDARADVAELIKEAPWALGPIKASGKRQTFTPRLGRDSSEEELMEQRSPPFAPRLGRRLVPFSPRLGRDQVYSPRLGRSAAPAKSQH